MQHVFLDANVLLDFYRYGLDDLSQIEKLLALMEGEEIVIYSNQLLRDEVNRGREAELSQSFEALRKFKFELKLPNYCSGLAEVEPLLDSLKNANKHHQILVQAVQAELYNKTLAADKLITKLFEKTVDITITPALLERASQRQQFNNPPRKRKDSIGDSLHWESLLSLERILRLNLISRDADFASEIEPTKLKDFLRSEWIEAHGTSARVDLYKSLVDFFKVKYPDIKLSEETEKNTLISQLAASPNFATTHSLVEELSKFDYYTNGQAAKLFMAFAENQQVYSIGQDEDVNKFFIGLQAQAYLAPPEYYDLIAATLGVDEQEFFFPF